MYGLPLPKDVELLLRKSATIGEYLSFSKADPSENGREGHQTSGVYCWFPMKFKEKKLVSLYLDCIWAILC